MKEIVWDFKLIRQTNPIKVRLIMEKSMVLELTLIKILWNMKVNGKTIKKMEMEEL